jgi:hypothetical protein
VAEADSNSAARAATSEGLSVSTADIELHLYVQIGN